MKFTSSSSIFHTYNNKRERSINTNTLLSIFFSSIILTSIFTFFIFYSPNPFIFIPKRPLDHQQQRQRDIFIEPKTGDPIFDESLPGTENLNRLHNGNENLVKQVTESENSKQPIPETEKLNRPVKLNDDDKRCDLFKGKWIRDLKGSLYTNSSCTTLPDSKNCFLHGRTDTDFLYWRWKPDQCELQMFDANTFLQIVRGKKMTFVGDSVARNHMESLLCLLSKEETPNDIYSDTEDRNRIWYFPNHNFTLSTTWSKFLVFGTERTNNNSGTGTYDLRLNKIEDAWAHNLPTMDIVVISSAHWFFRPIYLHQDNKLLGCVYCNERNVNNMSPSAALKLVFRSAFKYINNCKNCKANLVTLLRTFSPAHFENGGWDTGGGCNRTRPVGEDKVNLESEEMKIKSGQIEELERARKEGRKLRKKKVFRSLDVTRAMVLRPDGHPHSHWGNQWMKGFNDCVHWCLPGPVDVWSQFLMAVLRRISLGS